MLKIRTVSNVKHSKLPWGGESKFPIYTYNYGIYSNNKPHISCKGSFCTDSEFSLKPISFAKRWINFGDIMMLKLRT